MQKIKAKDMNFVDELGRIRVFRGFNVVVKCDHKVKSRHMENVFTDEYLSKLSADGFNLIRLGVTWSALESAPNKYNEALLNELESYIVAAEKYNMSIYMDIHQDLYCQLWSDGAPDWATLSGKYKFKPGRMVWAFGYFFDKAVHTAFDSFWDNRPIKEKKGKKIANLTQEQLNRGLQDYYALMLQRVAKMVQGHDNVIAYDVMNEPFLGKSGGKVFRKLVYKGLRVIAMSPKLKRIKAIKALIKKDTKTLLDTASAEILGKVTSNGNGLVKKFDLEKYNPFLNKMTTAIRAIDNERMVTVDNCYYSNLGIPCNAGPIIVNGKQDGMQCFAPHGYDFMVDTPEYEYANDGRVKFIFDEHRRSQLRLNMPVIVGEWGGFPVEFDEYSHADFVQNMFDEYGWSHTYWALFEENMECELLYKELVRPYPTAIAGTGAKFKYDSSINTFTLSYKGDASMMSATEIFLPGEPKSITCNVEYIVHKFNKNSKVFISSTSEFVNFEVKLA